MTWLRLAGAVVLLACTLAAGGCRAPVEPPAPPDAAASDEGSLIVRPAGAVDPPSTGEAADYRLGVGDRIRLTTFRHEDLSGEFELDGRGFFSMPLVGQVYAYGRTARQLEHEIELALQSGGYLVEPQVGVEVLNYRPVYVLGEVQAPGSYPYVDGLTVESAARLAGGLNPGADRDGILLSRGGANGPTFDVTPEIMLLPGDIIEIPKGAS